VTDPATLAAWDHRCLWHPFTQMADWLVEEPLVIAEAEGCTLVDVHGRRYLDGVSSLWCNVHGHRHPAIDRAVRRQLERVAHSTLLGLANVPSIELAHALLEVAPPGLTRVFYSDAGATAVEAALRIALQYQQLRGKTRRTRFASLPLEMPICWRVGATCSSGRAGSCALYSDVVYQRSPPSRRHRLHRAVGERLERAHRDPAWSPASARTSRRVGIGCGLERERGGRQRPGRSSPRCSAGSPRATRPRPGRGAGAARPARLTGSQDDPLPSWVSLWYLGHR
jgi:hypothetical protein